MQTSTFFRAMRAILVSALTVVMSCVLILAGTSAANAHAEGVTTFPVDNTQVAAPALISVTFTEELVLEYSSLTLFDGAGNPVPQEPATVDASGKVMSSAIPQSLAAGTYRVVWHALSVDGHESDGAFFFEVTSGTGGDGSAPAEPIAEPTAQPLDELPVDPEAEEMIAWSRAGDMPQDPATTTAQIMGWSALGAGVVAGIVVTVLVFVRRRRVG
jgi:methionine-rich copper-binding protein CopC